MSGFKEIIGQENIKEHLQEAIMTSKVSHAYILNGQSGSGKKMMAEAFAEALQCTSLDKNKVNNISDVEPCHECHSCMQAHVGSNPDIVYVSPEQGEKAIKVGDVRDKVINDIAIKPYEYKYKIYIIEDAQKLTEEAQNALLKTLEEPPEYAVLILLATNADILLETIRSRCIMLDLRPIPDEKVKGYLADKFPDKSDKEIGFAVSFSRGRIGRALDYLENEDFKVVKDDIIDFIKKSPDMTFTDASKTIRELESVKEEYIEDCLDIMSMWYRDVLVFKGTRDINQLIFKEEISDISKQAQTASYDGLNKIEEAIEKVRVRLNANVNFEITIELLFMTIYEGIKQRID